MEPATSQSQTLPWLQIARDEYQRILAAGRISRSGLRAIHEPPLRTQISEWRAETDAARKLRLSAQRWVDEFGPRSANLIFVGNAGSGKTRLAAAMAWELVNRGREVRFVSVQPLLDRLRNSYGDEHSEAEDVILDSITAGVELIVLDDFCPPRPSWDAAQAHRHNRPATDWVVEKLRTLLNLLANEGAKRIVTMNQKRADVSRWINDGTVESRLYANAVEIDQFIQLGDRRMSL